MTSIGICIGIGDTGSVFTRYRIDTKICSVAHPYPQDACVCFIYILAHLKLLHGCKLLMHHTKMFWNVLIKYFCKYVWIVFWFCNVILNYSSIVTNDWSEARVDPLKQANIKQWYWGQCRQGRVVIRGRAMGQGRRQTEMITSKQAGSERQAANDQERESTVQVVHR